MIWHAGLLCKTYVLGIRGSMFIFLRNFLADRFLQVRVGSALSPSFLLEKGVPQASVLSPLLFLIMVNDLVITDSRIKVSLFAGNKPLWVSEKSPKFLQTRLQRAFNELVVWCDLWGFHISSTKTQCILLSYSTYSIFLSFRGASVPLVSSVWFLGLIFDEHLTWNWLIG